MKAKRRQPVQYSKPKLTGHGLEVLAKRLQSLEKKRQRLIEDMQELASQSIEPDMGETPGLLQQIEAEIMRTDEIIKHAIVLQAKSSDCVTLGSTVRLMCGSNEYTFTVVEPVECNPQEGFISDKSPLGKALIGRRQNEQINLDSVRIKKVYKIVQIS